MKTNSSPRSSMLAAAPALRAFALSLCGNADRANDLVQDTYVRALANLDKFRPGTNMAAWLPSFCETGTIASAESAREKWKMWTELTPAHLPVRQINRRAWTTKNCGRPYWSCRVMSSRR